MSKFIRVFKSYKVLIVLSVILLLSIMQYLIVTSMTEKISRRLIDIKKQVRRFRISETEEKLSKLDKFIEQNRYPKMNRQEARSWVLESVEEFRLAYKVKIKEPIQEEGSAFRMIFEFDYLPEKPDDFIKLMEYIEGSISPFYIVRGMRSVSRSGLRRLTLKVEVVQPFYGGDYVFEKH